ncbi:hypothetical protein [Streptomyces sp. NBC_00154]|uniref:hypothetical protein n=1 Tax=Streptomyces sp. NBC_00154 TaxID=2975670 RepID=UPI00224F5929|nr:hypothetical protein [Streptomyces sp. NBC_00154]MCX5315856.1 hypothetical protein [Streptomyces sp. NBC_00154]
MEGLKGYDEASDIRDDLESKEIRTILQHLRTFGIFYAARLDLDYAMLQKFQAAYKHPEPGDCGPHSSDPTNTVMEEGGTGLAYWSNEERLELLRWYRYLFAIGESAGARVPSVATGQAELLQAAEFHGSRGSRWRRSGHQLVPLVPCRNPGP